MCVSMLKFRMVSFSCYSTNSRLLPFNFRCKACRGGKRVSQSSCSNLSLSLALHIWGSRMGLLSISASSSMLGNHCFLLSSLHREQLGFLFFLTQLPWGNQALVLVEYLQHEDTSWSSNRGSQPLLCIHPESWASSSLLVTEGFCPVLFKLGGRDISHSLPHRSWSLYRTKRADRFLASPPVAYGFCFVSEKDQGNGSDTVKFK